jgi:hypothetical protein
VRKVGNATAMYEPIVEKMWEPRHPTTLWTSTACYRDSFYFYGIGRKRTHTDHILLVISTYLHDLQFRTNSFRFIGFEDLTAVSYEDFYLLEYNAL